jgi:CDP-6-deoxy-D-xylo-4-hexulose-3-dehydrase
MKYPLTFSTWNKKENLAIKRIVKSGFFSMGKNVAEFEKKFAKYLGRKYAVMVNSGSSANLLAISSFFYKKKNKLKTNDEVIVPAIAWSTTYSPLIQLGLKVKVVDVKIDDLNVDMDQLEKAITSKTKMIIGVSILGVPARLDKIKQFCKRKKIIFFEDNCESLGSKIGSKKTGTFGDISSHSFFYSHHISTMEGGMCVTDDYELYCIMLAMRAHGWTRELPRINPLTSKKDDVAYNFVLPGYNLRPGEIHAAVGLEQIKKLDKLIRYRVKNWKLFYKLFKDDERFFVQKTKYFNSSFAFTLILKKSNKLFKQKIFKVLKQNNIAYRLITGGCFTKHPYAKYFKLKIHGKLTNSIKAHEDGFFVGNAGQDLTKEIYKLYSLLKNL